MNYPIRSYRPRNIQPFQTNVEREPTGAADPFDAVRGFRGLVLLCAISGAILTLVIGWVQTPIYRAQAVLEVGGPTGGFPASREADAPMREYVTDPYIQTQLKILRSDTLLQRVADKLSLAERSEYRRTPKIWRRRERMAGWALSASAGDEVMKELARQVTVRASGQSNVIEVFCESPNPQLAADIVNTLAGEFMGYNVERRARGAKLTGELLEKQVGDLKANLERSENELQRYAARAGLLLTGNNETVADLRLRQLQDALSKAQESRVAEQAKYERAQGSPAESLPDVLDDDTLRNYRVKLTDLRSQLAELNTTLKPAHYKVKARQAQIRELETALQRGRAHALERIRNQYLSAQQREKLLSEDYNRQFRVVTEQSLGAVRYNMLKREVDSNRQLYMAMLQKVKEAGIASEIRASNVQVIDPATNPSDPVRPNQPLYGAVGLLAGGLFGAGCAVYRKRRFAIQAPGDASLHLQLPELGAIPQRDSNVPMRLTSVMALCRNGSHKVPAGDDAAADSEALELASWRRKQSVIAESFRATLASVRFSERSGRWPRAVAVTSAGPAEGKTVVATNLAIVLAESDRQVLLVDGDLRRPRLHDIFGIPNTSGFADLLRGSGNRRDLSSSLALQTEVPGLYVLPSGPDSVSAANLLPSDRAAEVLHRLRQQFDAVVIDTPPLDVADPRILGQLADGVVLVIRANRTPPDVAFAASRQLLGDGASVLGTILNSWNPKKTSNHYTYRLWQYTHPNYMATFEKR